MADHHRSVAVLNDVALPAFSGNVEKGAALLIGGCDIEDVTAVRVERVVAWHPGRRSKPQRRAARAGRDRPGDSQLVAFGQDRDAVSQWLAHRWVPVVRSVRVVARGRLSVQNVPCGARRTGKSR